MKEIFPRISDKITSNLNISFSNLKDWLSSFDIRLSLPTSPTFQILNGIKWIYSQLLYFIEDVASEQNILTAERPESIYGIASLNGHEATRSISSSGFIEIQAKIPTEQIGKFLRISNHTQFKNLENGLIYTLWLNSNSVSINLYSNVTTKLFAYQGTLIKKSIYSQDKKLFTISVESSKSISMEPVIVKINSEVWNKFESLYDMNSNSNGYLLKNNYLGGFNITFGNDNFGKIPENGSLIEVFYLESDGFDGNFIMNTKFEAIGNGTTDTNQILNLNDYIISNSKSFNFGSDSESLELTKQLSTKNSQSSLLSLSRNYEHFLSRYSSILKVKVTEKKDESLVLITLFLNFKEKIKETKNYFKLKESDFIPSSDFIKKVENLFKDSSKVIMTGKVQILKPQIEKFALVFYIKQLIGFDTSTIKNSVIEQITEHLINRIYQNKIQRSDLIGICENISGIDSVTVMITKENINIQPNGFGDIVLDENSIAWITGDFYDSNGIYYRNSVPDGNITGPITIYFVE